MERWFKRDGREDGGEVCEETDLFTVRGVKRRARRRSRMCCESFPCSGCRSRPP